MANGGAPHLTLEDSAIISLSMPTIWQMVPIDSFSIQVTVTNRRMYMLNMKETRQNSGLIR